MQCPTDRSTADDERAQAASRCVVRSLARDLPAGLSRARPRRAPPSHKIVDRRSRSAPQPTVQRGLPAHDQQPRAITRPVITCRGYQQQRTRRKRKDELAPASSSTDPIAYGTWKRTIGGGVRRDRPRRVRARRAGAARAPRPSDAAADAGAAGQRRLRDGHPGDQHRAGARRGRAGAGRASPATVRRRRARARLHHARGARRPPGRALRGRRDRAGAGRLDARRHRSPTARRSSPTSGSRVVVADIALALAEAGPAAYDLVLLDVDNGPGYLVHDANAALYEAPFLAAVRHVAAARRRARGLVGRRRRRPARRPCDEVFGDADDAALRRPAAGPRRAATGSTSRG